MVTGQPVRPDILSNKVILTPIHPGNQRGAIWAERELNRGDWVADVDFRASGEERAGGNLNIWLVKDGLNQVGSNSVYTVGRFEGLVLVVDQHGNSGGMLRGFLNDGNTDYSKQQSLDNLAFGHCGFSYRNLGRPAQIKLMQSQDGFKVEIDGRRCFDSSKISIPNGYKFGVTAATPENPDSFEVFKLVVMSEVLGGPHHDQDHGQKHQDTNNYQYGSQNHDNHNQNNYQQQQQQQQKNHEARDSGGSNFDYDLFNKNSMPDENADVFQTSKAQFQDLHNRIQQTAHQVQGVYRGVGQLFEKEEERYESVKEMVGSLRSELVQKLGKLDQLNDLQHKIADLQRDFGSLRDDINRRMTASEAATRGVLSDHHRTLSQSVTDSLPGHGRLISIFIGFQIFLVVVYVLYKRRKSAGPKKYL